MERLERLYRLQLKVAASGAEDTLGVGTVQLLRSLLEDPAGLGDLARIAGRKLVRSVASDAPPRLR